MKANAKGQKRRQRKEFLTGILFIAPGFIGFLVFIFAPVLISVILSFCKWDFLQGLSAIRFNGFSNYLKLFNDPWFLSSYFNNIMFTVITVPALTILGLVSAEIMNRHIFGRSVVRIMFFIPYIASVVAVCTVWQVLLHPGFGPVNSFLKAIGMQNPPKWLADLRWSLPSIMIIYIWQNIGYYSVVFLAGLKGIPQELYEAAAIDGAGSVRQFFSVTVPLIQPTTFFLVTMGIIGSFKVFDHISVLTQGGPGSSSSVMAYYVYRTAFEEYNMGYANTLAWALFVLIFIVTVIQFRMQRKFSR
ncbi:sugar ABC transporter permease [Clostridiales bacterium COT073_COT-073]|nr:sugar ABC transporter permease [Clostridiales bacterium COT073_COT-073]